MPMLTSPRGRPTSFHVRDGTSDLSIAQSTFGWQQASPDEYRLFDLHVAGLVVDVGAHIGTVAIAILMDNPQARVIAIEPIAENCAMIRATAEANRLSNRLTVIEGAIGATSIPYDFTGSSYASDNRYIGGMASEAETAQAIAEVPAVTLTEIVAKYGPIEALKLDCEGCEHSALADPAVRDIPIIFGEGHGQNWRAKITAALDATHDIDIIEDNGGTGVFRAVAR